MNSTLSPSLDATPSKFTRNSVFSLRLASCSSADLADNTESISSINITEGCLSAANPNIALTIFSVSPKYLEVVESEPSVIGNREYIIYIYIYIELSVIYYYSGFYPLYILYRY